MPSHASRTHRREAAFAATSPLPLIFHFCAPLHLSSFLPHSLERGAPPPLPHLSCLFSLSCLFYLFALFFFLYISPLYALYTSHCLTHSLPPFLKSEGRKRHCRAPLTAPASRTIFLHLHSSLFILPFYLHFSCCLHLFLHAAPGEKRADIIAPHCAHRWHTAHCFLPHLPLCLLLHRPHALIYREKTFLCHRSFLLPSSALREKTHARTLSHISLSFIFCLHIMACSPATRLPFARAQHHLFHAHLSPLPLPATLLSFLSLIYPWEDRQGLDFRASRSACNAFCIFAHCFLGREEGRRKVVRLVCRAFHHAHRSTSFLPLSL